MKIYKAAAQADKHIAAAPPVKNGRVELIPVSYTHLTLPTKA